MNGKEPFTQEGLDSKKPIELVLYKARLGPNRHLSEEKRESLLSGELPEVEVGEA
ncbi:hypothetical protein MYX65_10710 [Acidobacteria bacterium AH-259-L09]|nr:hypothetical protein [Acidobacteria bacterium AH-259-L09]